MSLSERYQQLVDSGLIVPVATVPNRFKYPTMLVYVPIIATDAVADKNSLDRIMLDVQLERHPK